MGQQSYRDSVDRVVGAGLGARGVRNQTPRREREADSGARGVPCQTPPNPWVQQLEEKSASAPEGTLGEGQGSAHNW